MTRASSALYHPARAVCYALLGAHADRVLIGCLESDVVTDLGLQAVLEGLNLDPNMIPTDPSAVTLDDALNFASLLGQKGAVVLEKAQESGMIDADAVKTMAILDSAIRQTTMASKMDNLKVFFFFPCSFFPFPPLLFFLFLSFLLLLFSGGGGRGARA